MSKNYVKRGQNHFASAVHADIQRSTFLRPSTHKTTFDAGRLIPVYIDEVLPADTMDIDIRMVARTLTPIFPTMDGLKLDFYSFFVPYRLVWDGWEQLQGENKTGPWAPTTPPALVPQATFNGAVTSGSLSDYMGIPVGYNHATNSISALPYRAYYLIWNEWFRDQNLQAPYSITLGNTGVGGTGYADVPPRLVNKPHDYFTSCLPAPQKGQSTLIPIELNELLPVLSLNQYVDASSHPNSDAMKFRYFDNDQDAQGNLSALTQGVVADGITPGSTNVVYPSNLWADGRGIQASSSTINELRTAFQIQKLLERDARGGTRYRELLKAHFGVTVEDYRVQVPEFLGKYSTTIGTYQVPQTSSTDNTTPQGNVAAFAHAQGSGNIVKKSFSEYGLIMILAVARQEKTYQQGIERMWFRKDRFDFYYPALANISEQPVYNREIYAKNTTQDEEVFGYQEAWADYRYKPSRVSGKMRSGVSGSIDMIHYADYYTSRPTLVDSWIQDNSSTNLGRTLAVSSGDQIWLDLAIDCKATRPMPLYSIPGLIDHF